MTVTDIDPPPSEDEELPRRRAWLRWFTRGEIEQEKEPMSTDLVQQTEPQEATQLEGWAWVEKHALHLPDRRYVKQRVKHAAPKVPGMLVKLVFVTIPGLVWREGVGPVWVGSGKVILAVVNFVQVKELEEAHKSAEGALKTRTHITKSKSNVYRLWTVLFGCLTMASGMIYLYYAHLTVFWITCFFILGALDLIGRNNTEKTNEVVPVYREPLREGMPYKQLTESIQAAFNETVGIDANNHPLVRMDGICTYDFNREEWRQNISTYQEIKEEHIRTIERSIGARLRSLRLLEVPEVATRKILAIKHGDPFAVVPTAPWRDTNSKSITEGLLLGVSQADHPFIIHVAGVHVGIVAQSGGGKSEGVISAVIDAILPCYNATIVGIDLTEGPLFPIWGDCIQKVAYTPEDAEELLDWILAEIKERAKILGDIARSDDPNVKGREWNAELAEKYNKPSIHVVIDELAQATKFNGQPRGTIDLAGRIEVIGRTGSKHWVSLITGSQKTGKSDAGSTSISSQMMAWMVGPCTQDDANEIFSPELRRAGYAPNLLKSAVRGKAKNDAGRVYVKAAGFGPDVYCTWTPMPEEEIKRRRARRLAEGIPMLEDNNIVEGKTVPNTLAALSACLDDLNPPDGRLPSKLAAEWISTRSNETIDQVKLAARLVDELGSNAPKTHDGRCELAGKRSAKHYLGKDIDNAMSSL